MSCSIVVSGALSRRRKCARQRRRRLLSSCRMQSGSTPVPPRVTTFSCTPAARTRCSHRWKRSAIPQRGSSESSSETGVSYRAYGAPELALRLPFCDCRRRRSSPCQVLPTTCVLTSRGRLIRAVAPLMSNQWVNSGSGLACADIGAESYPALDIALVSSLPYTGFLSVQAAASAPSIQIAADFELLCETSPKNESVRTGRSGPSVKKKGRSSTGTNVTAIRFRVRDFLAGTGVPAP
jgi:hypothetical protein